jgi:hypothetical protein
MSLDDVVQLTITTESAQVSRAAFNIPMIAAYHTHWAERARVYSSSTMLATMEGEGFLTTEMAYILAQKFLSQNPKVPRIVLGRRAAGAAQVVNIKPAAAAANATVYSLKVNGTSVSFTSDADATTAEILAGLETAIDALPLVTATDASGTHVAVSTTAAGTLASFTELSSNLSLVDATADAGIAADLTAIRAANSSWYGFVIDSNASAEIAAATAWAETQKIIFGANTADTDAMDRGGVSTTDLGSDLQDLSLARSYLLFHPDIKSGAAAGWMGKVFGAWDPGEATWNYKTIANVSVTELSTNEQAALQGKNVNIYITLGGRNVTNKGVTPSGEFIDITVFVDWIYARIQERVFALLANSPKIPYSNTGVNMMCAEVLAVLQDGVNVGGLLEGDPDADIPAPFCVGPNVADVDPVDRAGRHLPDIEFGARLAGAIHTVGISGKLSV